MDKIVYSVRLDVQKNALQATLHGFRVGDTASRQLNITLHQSGKTINLSEFDDVIMFVRKEGSSTPTMSLCSVEDNTIIYDVLQSDVSSEGEVEFTVRVQSGDSIAYAPKFNALVIDPECNAAVAPGTPEYSILETLTSRVEYLEERQGEMIAEGIQEFVTEHKEELQGPKGDPGETGPKGDRGEPGGQGPKGDSGVIVSVEEPSVEEGDIWINPEGIVVLDKATPTELGLVKPDGRTIFVDEDGVISARGAGTVGIATTTEAGIVKPDGTTVTVDADGTLHAVGGGGGSTSVEWNAISGKPSTFPPSAHKHGKNDITDFPTEMKPTAHTHITSDITDLTYSNPNLLDNPFFTVNQRQGKIVPVGKPHYADANCTVLIGDITAPTAVVPYGNVYRYAFATSEIDFYVKASDVIDGYVGNGYTVDRWKGRTNTSVLKINADASITTEGSWAIAQILETSLIEQIRDKTVTISALLADGSIVSKSGTAISTAINNNNVWLTVEGRLQVQGNIKAVKLEVGSVSTLVNDIAPNYEEELVKCKTSKADSTDTYANQTVAMREDSIEVAETVCDYADGVSLNTLLPSDKNTHKVYIIGSYCTNVPSGYIWGWLEVVTVMISASVFALVEQTLHNCDGQVWKRRYFGGAWTEWLTIPSNIVTTTAPTEGEVSDYPIGTTFDVIED